MHALEQLLVQNKRTRDAEAHAMNARLFQWRYGVEYGRTLFTRTASTSTTGASREAVSEAPTASVWRYCLRRTNRL